MKRLYDFCIRNLVSIVVFALTVYCAFVYPVFCRNAPLDLIKRSAAYGIMALGMGCVMLVGGTDLSMGRIMGLMAIVAASLQVKYDAPNKLFPAMHPWPLPLVFLLILLLGGLFGLFNGYFAGKRRIMPWLVTLCSQMILYGIMLIYLYFGTGYGKGGGCSNLTNEYKNLIAGNLVSFGSLHIPNYVWYFILITAIVWFIWNKTRLGEEMRLVGLNRQAAELNGVNAGRVIMLVFMIGGMLCGVNGFVEAARVGGPGGSTGNGAECDAIAACLIGGVSQLGGRGRIAGIVYGVIVLQLLSVSLQWMSVSANYVYIIKGMVIVTAAACDMRRYDMGKQ